MASIQYLKHFDLQVHRPNLPAETAESALATLRQGQEFGELARTTFQVGVPVKAV